MRRKRERSATTKSKSSPERKQEKIKRTRSKRRKQSTSSGNDSNDEVVSGLVSEKVNESEQNVEQSSKTEGSSEELQDQVWQVKTAKGSGDGGEIQKLKICLTRPPSTPERAERSPRSKRKYSRATSLSDSANIEVLDEKKKGKHRTKRSICESSENCEKNNETQNIDQETEIQTESTVVEPGIDIKESSDQSSQSNEDKVESNIGSDGETLQSVSVKTKLNYENTESNNVTIDLNKEESAFNEKHVLDEEKNISNNEIIELIHNETEENEPRPQTNEVTTVDDKENVTECEVAATPITTTISKMEDNITLKKPSQQEIQNENIHENEDESETLEITYSERKRSLSVDKSEILELHAEDSKVDISDQGSMEFQKEENVEDKMLCIAITQEGKVSSIEFATMESVGERQNPSQKETKISPNKIEVPNLEKTADENLNKTCESPVDQQKLQDQPECTPISSEENIHNGSSNIVINRKRRWGSRPNKLTSQKSITISTDVLKEIIPDVKPVEFEEVIEEKKPYKKKVDVAEKVERPILPKIVIDNTDAVEQKKDNEEQSSENLQVKETTNLAIIRKISIVKETDNITVIRPPSPPRHKQSNILYITNLVRPFTLPQLKNLLQRTGRIVENGFWIDKIKSKCFVIYENEDQAVETRHALHGVTWPVSNPKTLHVDFSTQEDFEQAKVKEESEGAQNSTIPGTVEDWLREQDLKRERGELEKPWERKTMREWDVGKNDKGIKLDKEKEKLRADDRSIEKRRHHSPERSPEPAKKFKKKEEAPAKLLDDLFRKTKTTPCIYWLPLSAETIAIKEEQRRQHMAEFERGFMEYRRTQRRH